MSDQLPTDHSRARSLIFSSLGRTLDPNEERELAMHLVACAECKNLFEGLNRLPYLVRPLVPAGLAPHELELAISRATEVLDGNPDPADTSSELPAVAPPPVPVTTINDNPEDSGDVLKIGSLGPDESWPPRLDPEPDYSDGPSRAGTLITVLVAVLALALGAGWFFYARDAGIVEPEATPEPESGAVLAADVRRVISGMDSFGANFEMSRLDAYETSDEGRYSFAASVMEGRIASQAPFDLREDLTFGLPGTAPVKTSLVRSATGLTLYRQTATGRTAVTDTRPPLLSFSGPTAKRFGVIEAALGVAIDDLAAAGDVTDLGEVTLGEGTGTRYSFEATPTKVNHADRYEVTIDAKTGLPVRISATISRTNASVFADGEVITEDALDKAFLGKDRVSTLKLTLTDVDVNGSRVRPSDFEFDPDSDTTTSTRDSDFEPLDPADIDGLPPLPTGFELTAAANNTAPGSWGPEKAYRAPDQNRQFAFTRGATTILVDVRDFDSAPSSGTPDPSASPSAETPEPDGNAPVLDKGVFDPDPLVAKSPARLDGFWFETHSDLQQPVLYGTSGDRTIVVTGWADQDLLAEFASMFINVEDLTIATPDPDESPEPSPSPTSSASVKPSASATTEP